MNYHPEFGAQQFSDNHCFLCGSSADITTEHVFPKWLQRSYDLWNQRLDLLNHSSIPYKNLCVPCCGSCNSEHLSRIETAISNAVSKGYQEANKLAARTWYLWAGKIFYGVLRKELSLVSDRSDPTSRPIASQEVLKSLSNLHLFLQEVRDKHFFPDEVPYTVLICNLHETSRLFDIRDDFFQFTMAIRMGEIGLIVSFEDGGLIRETYGRYVEQVNAQKLHPVQFTELYAKVCYQNSLREQRLSYLTASNFEGKGRASTIVLNSSTAVLDWDQEEFAASLQFHLKDRIKVEFQPPNRVSTWMVESDGSLMIKPLREWEGI
jgi:hypothetical protein